MEKTIESFIAECPFAKQHLATHAERQAQLADILSEPYDLTRYRAVMAMLEPLSETEWMAKARALRHLHMLRIAARDYLGSASLEQTLQETSDLAQCFIEAADAQAQRTMIERHGEVHDERGDWAPMLILGMGKLGGRELNFSSDIDLIFFHAAVGESNGRRSLDAHTYMVRYGQLIIKLLSELGPAGRLYDVDMRLRPFGKSGPLAMSIEAAENYYQTQGREWERYAMQKARLMCGRAKDWEAVHQWLRPFVYRRYLDYGVIDALRELKLQIREGCKDQDNIKLGFGGIRTAEFLVHSLQLIRGGREPLLQTTHFLEALSHLAATDILPAADAAQIETSYRLLRKLENIQQMLRDKPMHVLSQDEAEQAVIARWAGAEDWNSLAATLDAQRTALEAAFQTHFQSEDEDSDPVQEKFASLWIDGVEADDLQEGLYAVGLSVSGSFADALAQYRSGFAYRSASREAQRRVDQSVLMLLRMAPPEQAALDGLTFIRTIAGRSGYLQALIDRPSAFERLLTLFVQSPMIAQQVTKTPMVIDELINPSSISSHDAATTAAALAQTYETSGELDEVMDSFRAAKRQYLMRVALQDLDAMLPLMKVSDQLTWTAEALVDAGTAYVQQQFEQKHGPIEEGGVLWVGYGKLGGLELSYGSDLDLVALRADANAESTGERPLDSTTWHIRLVQRWINFMTAPTALGRLYEIDLRLRPNGDSGALVAPISRYRQYLQDDAWTWELQALVRARAISGPPALMAQFDEIRREILCAKRDPEGLQKDVREMRQKMRDSLDKSRDDQFDLKHGQGGIVDLEFIVQYIVLRFAAEHPALVEFTDNVRILERAVQAGVLSDETGQSLISAYIALREVSHRQALRQHKGLVPLTDDLKPHCQSVAEQFFKILGL